MAGSLRVLVVEARFYQDISDKLALGAMTVLKNAGVAFDRIAVPGIMETPPVVEYATQGALAGVSDQVYDGFVILGCAIKGQTDHYEHVSRAAFDGLMRLTLDYSLAMGHGILTCQNLEHAMERADPAKRNYGGRAAEACLALIRARTAMGLQGAPLWRGPGGR